MVAVTFLCLTFTYDQLPTVLFRVDPHDLLGQDQQSWNEHCSTGAECWAAEREKVQCQKKKKFPSALAYLFCVMLVFGVAYL